MRNASKALIGASMAGVLTVGVLVGVAAGHRQAADGDPYELLAAGTTGLADSAGPADLAVEEAVSLTQGGLRDQKDRPRLRVGVRRALIGIHGDATVRTRGGGFATYTWQRGGVTAASDRSLTVKSADGVSWTWTVTSDTKVRKNGGKSTSSALASGDTVFVLGQPSGNARTAQGVVVPGRVKE